MSIHEPLRRFDVTADLQMHVSRNANGTLLDGIETVLTRVDAVQQVEEIGVSTVAPRLNDMAVETTVTLTVEAPDSDGDSGSIETMLANGFGVQTVEIRTIEGVS